MGKKSAAKKSKKSEDLDPRAKILVSLQEDRDHLEEVGSRVVVSRLFQVATDRIALAAADEGVLGTFGFGAAWRTELEHEVATLKAKSHGQTEGTPQPVETGRSLAKLVASANKWLKTYGTVAKNSGPVVRDDAPKVTHHDHSPKLLAAELEKLASFIESHAEATQGHGGGQKFADQGKAIGELLSKARAEHTVERAAVPVAAQSIHFYAGVVENELVRLSRAAHSELPGTRAAKYSLDELHPHSHTHSDDNPGKPPAPPSKTGNPG